MAKNNDQKWKSTDSSKPSSREWHRISDADSSGEVRFDSSIPVPGGKRVAEGHQAPVGKAQKKSK